MGERCANVSSEYLENRIYELLEAYLEHRPFHLHRLAAVCTGVLLAGTTELSKVARWIRRPTQQSSRTQFLKRFLMSPYFSSLLSAYQASAPRLQSTDLAYRDRPNHPGATSPGPVDDFAVIS